MRLATLLRATWAWVVLPAAALMTLLFSKKVGPADDGYALAAQTAVLGTAVLVLPLACATGAIVGRRFAPLLTTATPRRSTAQLLASHLALPTAGVVLPLLLAMFLAARAAEPGGGLDLRLALVLLLGAAAYAVVGFALGLHLRLLVAGPLALVLPYLVIGFPPAMQPLWLRHLTWVDLACCRVTQDLDPRAFAAVLLLHLGLLLVGSWGVARAVGRTGSGPRGAVAAGVVLGLAGTLSAWSITETGAVARTGELRCTEAGGSTLCLWPQHEAVRGRAEGRLRQLGAAARRTGATLPRPFTERENGPSTGPEAQVFLHPKASLEITAVSLAGAAGGRLPEVCESGSLTDDRLIPRQMVAMQVTQQWWVDQARLDVPAGEQYALDATAAAAYRRLTSQPMPRQVAWLERTGAQLRACQDVRLP